jgi:uncharacterized protein (DUF2252 family)
VLPQQARQRRQRVLREAVPTASLSPAERAEIGKAIRQRVSRESHATFEPAPNRTDPLALLEEQAKTRVPELIPVRYGRMLASPFSYYRGAALAMARDLATTPTTGIGVQACGDAHLSNFGIFGTPERRLIFDINDFDETFPGPWEWDVKRLAASMEVAARQNGYKPADRRRIVMSTVAHYRQAMRQFAGMDNLDVWYASLDVEKVQRDLAPRLTGRQRKLLKKGVTRAHNRDNLQASSKLMDIVDGEPHIVADPPLLVPAVDLFADEIDRAGIEEMIRGLLHQYRDSLPRSRQALIDQFKFADLARKVVGVGSVGTRCWIVLMLGKDAADPLFLQVKEAEASVLGGQADGSPYRTEGQRVVDGQQIMQAASDIFLGWMRLETPPDLPPGQANKPRDFYVRQLRDWKLSIDVETMIPSGMQIYGELCGWTLARAHARSGDRIAIASYLGGSDVFDRAITSFASAYADQNERDYAELAVAAAAGKISVKRDV